jgi:hypothetical protein
LCTYTYGIHEVFDGFYTVGWYLTDNRCGAPCSCPPKDDPQLPGFAVNGQRRELKCRQ